MSSVFVLKKKNSVTMGWAESLKSLLSERRKCSCVPLPKG
jgi:hypothetical protein